MNTVIKTRVKKPYTIPLYDEKSSDDSTPVAYWCAWNLDEQTRAQLVEELTGAKFDDYDPVADPSFPQRKLKEWGLRTALPRMP